MADDKRGRAAPEDPPEPDPSPEPPGAKETPAAEPGAEAETAEDDGAEAGDRADDGADGGGEDIEEALTHEVQEPAARPAAASTAPMERQHKLSDNEARNWAALAHVSSFAWLVGIPGVIGPLVVWLLKKDEHPFAAEQSREALNFQISILLYAAVALAAGIVLVLTLVGILLLPLLILGAIAFAILALVLPVVGALKASNGEHYRYPVTVRFIN